MTGLLPGIGLVSSIGIAAGTWDASNSDGDGSALVAKEVKIAYKNIFEAAGRGSVDDVRFFIKQCVNVNSKDKFGETPLHHAARSNTIEVLQYLISLGCDVNAKEKIAPFQYATAFNPSIDVLKYLISLGCDVNAKNNSGETLLHHAARSNFNIRILKFLIEQGLDVNAKDFKGRTPLDWIKKDENWIKKNEEKQTILRQAGGKTAEELKG